jgi:ABC-type amino acid transport substrate-binding protein
LVGTVIAYRYPVLGAALGSHFRRTDVPDMQNNLRRLAAGRVNYAIAERGALAYYLRQHPDARLSVAWQVERYDASCAFSRKSKVSADDLDRVIDRLVSDGSIERLLARYR